MHFTAVADIKKTCKIDFIFMKYTNIQFILIYVLRKTSKDFTAVNHNFNVDSFKMIIL